MRDWWVRLVLRERCVQNRRSMAGAEVSTVLRRPLAADDMEPTQMLLLSVEENTCAGGVDDPRRGRRGCSAS